MNNIEEINECVICLEDTYNRYVCEECSNYGFECGNCDVNSLHYSNITGDKWKPQVICPICGYVWELKDILEHEICLYEFDFKIQFEKKCFGIELGNFNIDLWYIDFIKIERTEINVNFVFKKKTLSYNLIHKSWTLI